MTPPDHTTDAGVDDWFTDPVVTESDSFAAGTSEYPAKSRLTVLTEQQLADTDRYDEWFDNVAGDEPSAAADGRGSVDARTSALHGQGASTAPAVSTPSWWRRHRSAVAVTGALTVLLGGVSGAVLALTGVGDTPQSPAPLLSHAITAAPTSVAPAAAGAAAADVSWCAGQGDGKPVSEDSADPGAAAIWRFEKAFYFGRSGVAARAVGAPDAVMASAQRLQAGIDQLEPAVEFCVLADPVGTGIYDVTVVERGPGIDARMSRQRITTSIQQDGRTLLSAIMSR